MTTAGRALKKGELIHAMAAAGIEVSKIAETFGVKPESVTAFLQSSTPAGITVRCHHCQGAGRIPLPDHLEETLRLVRSGQSTAGEIAQYLPSGIGITAVNNRLEDLRLLGLVTRTKNGKTWIYSAVEVKK